MSNYKPFRTHSQCEISTRKTTESNIDLTQYLESLQVNSKRKSVEIPIRPLQQKKTIAWKTTMTARSMGTIPSYRDIIDYGKGKERLLRQKTLLQRRQQLLQELYFDAHREQIAILDYALNMLVHNMYTLKDYLNNKRKMFFVIRRLIGGKKSLSKLIINEEHECLLEPMSAAHIRQQMAIKETITEGPISIVIDTYNYGLTKELQNLAERVQETVIQVEAQGIAQLEQSILVELHGVNGGSFRFNQRSMRRPMIQETLHQMERRLGQFPLISNRNKEANVQITHTIQNINDKFIK